MMLGRAIDENRGRSTVNHTKAAIKNVIPLLLGALALFGLTPQAKSQETIGGGTTSSPAVGPAPSFGIGGPNMVLVKNWHFGTDGTIKNYTDMSANFNYHDQFGTIDNGGNYGSKMVSPDAANALSGQPIEGVDCPPVRAFFTDSMQTYLQPLDGATTCDPNLHNTGCGSFQSKWRLPNAGALLGQDIVEETRVRYVTPPYFWFAVWNAGNQWKWDGTLGAEGGEFDQIESFGYDNGGGNTNFDGRYWHSNSVGNPGYDNVDYSGWGSGMASVGINSYDATQYHTWTLYYKADNSFAFYVDGIRVQYGSNYWWTFGNLQGDPAIDFEFLYDAGWGHTQVGSVDHPLPATAFAGKYYEWNYSRVYLSGTGQATPTGLSATAGNTQVALAWTASTGATSYNVYRGTTAGGESATAIATGITATSYTNTGLTNGTPYYYTVAAVGSNGTSGYSNEASATPTAPLDPLLTGTNFNDGAGPWGGNQANTADMAYDGNTGTFYDCANATGFTGIDLGAGKTGTVTTIRYWARSTFPSRMIGGVFEGSNSLTTGYVTLGTVATASDTAWTSITVTGAAAYRYLRYTDNQGGECNVAEVEFHGILHSGSAPPAPTGLSATAGNTQVALAWTASTGATSYNVYRGTTAGGESATAIATGITTTSYANTGLTNGTKYYYKVKAVNSAGTSGYSNEASATPVPSVPLAPTGLSATAGNTQVALAWTASTGATSYNVYRGTTAGGESATAIATGITATSYTNTGLTNGTTYYYKVKAVNSAGTSGYSNEAFATPTAGLDPLLTGTNFNDGAGPYGGNQANTANMAYDGNTGTFYDCANATGFTGIDLGAGKTGTVTTIRYWGRLGIPSRMIGGVFEGSNSLTTGYVTLGTVATASDTAWTSITVTGAAAYRYLRYTDNQGGNCNVAEVEFHGILHAVAPSAPTGLSATAGNTQVALAWTASTGATSYNVYRGTTAGGESATAIATGITTTSYANTGLTNGTKYYYKVKAVNSLGTSGYSNEASATPIVGTSYTIFTTQAPNYDGTDGPYEMGVKFQSTTAGQVTGVRYYKAPDESGTHTGHLWSSSGTLLGTVTFSGETSSGWQSATFSAPISIAANTTYVASVNSVTAYDAVYGGLSTGVTNGPLSTVSDGNNCVYSATVGAFPTSSNNNSNYFRDVIFVTVP